MQTVCYDPYSGTLGRFTRAEIFALVAEAGYEGINIPVNAAFLGELTPREIEDAVKLGETHNLISPTVGFGNHIVTDPRRTSDALKHFEIVLDVAKRVNAQLLGIWPNPPKDASRQEALDTLAENLSQMLPALDEHGMVFALEFEKGCPLDNYRDGVKFINDTDLRLRLTADTYHLFNDGADAHEAALAMKGLLGDVHISGSHRGEPGTDEFDFPAFARGVKETDFSGPLVVQYRLEDVESVARSCAFTKKFREMLREGS